MGFNLKKSWNEIAKSYQREFWVKGWGAQKSTSHPMDFVKSVKGKRIIELGSGAGQNSILLAKKGAITTALDFSEKQIEYGKLLAEKEKVKVNFILGDLNKLRSYFEKNQFDVVFSSYAFQYVENLNRLFADVYKILKKKGLFVFGLDHPIWTSGEWKKIGKREYYVIDDYFKRRKRFWVWKFKKGVKASFQLYHRTIEDFFVTLTKNGFKVEMITEPYPLKPRRKRSSQYSNYSYKRMRKIPATIIFKCRK